jgi:hypothetical protein
VLFAAGAQNAGAAPITTNSAELYDPTSGYFTLTKDVNNNVTPLNTARHVQTATMPNNGTVLFAGGVVSTVLPAPDPSTLQGHRGIVPADNTDSTDSPLDYGDASESDDLGPDDAPLRGHGYQYWATTGLGDVELLQQLGCDHQ